MFKKQIFGLALQIMASWFNRCIKGADCISKEEQMMTCGKISFHPASSNFQRADDDDTAKFPLLYIIKMPVHPLIVRASPLISFSLLISSTMRIFLAPSTDNYTDTNMNTLCENRYICIPLAYTDTNIFGGYVYFRNAR